MTKGQWLQMNATTLTCPSSASLLTCSPLTTSGNVKVGMRVPSSRIVEEVAAMLRGYCTGRGLASCEERQGLIDARW
jgi:hypothetical protein